MLRKMTLVTLFVVLSSPALANSSVADAVKQCAQTQNSLQRLVCFDRIAARLQDYSDEVLPEAVQRQTPTIVPPKAVANAETKVADFGRAEVVEDTLIARVASLSYDRNDYFTVTLNNGQVWRQTEVSRIKISEGDKVTIEQGVFGSFILKSEASNRTARVKRVK